MNYDELLKNIVKLKPNEKMALSVELQLLICKETGIDKRNEIFIDELKNVLRRLKHEK